MKPVTVLGYSINSKKTSGEEIDLLIDKKPLLAILDEAYFQLSKRDKWAEKKDAKLVTKALQKSSKKSGEFALFVCGECKMAEDILLSPFKVIHEGEYILWKVKPPGAGTYFEKYAVLEFKFHRHQYQTTVNSLLDDKMNPNF